jgi:hypothetical protein
MQAMDEISAAGVQDEMSSPVFVFSIHFVAVLGDDGFSINQYINHTACHWSLCESTHSAMR